MLVIRKEQMEALKQAAVQNFENRMVEYLEEYFPKSCRMLGEIKIRDIIRYGLDRAKNYDLVSEDSVCLYISLMFMFGSGFDRDPQLPWTAKFLNDETLPDEAARVDLLYDRAMDYLNEIAGTDNVNVNEAFVKVSRERIEALPQLESPDFHDQMSAKLDEIFPAKCEYIGRQCIDHLIQEGIRSASIYGINNSYGVAVYIGLMFMLGSGFDTDLQFPWSKAILNDKTITGTQKANELYAAAMKCLEEWLA